MPTLTDIKVSKLFHHERTKQEHRLCGTIELYVFGLYTCSAKFRFPKHRNEIIKGWYKSNPAILKRDHYFIIKYHDLGY